MSQAFTTREDAAQPRVFTFHLAVNHDINLRAVIDQRGEPWFVAADVCVALSIGNSRDAMGRLDDEEKGVGLIDTLGGAQKMSIVNESGLYSLVLGSRKPEAKAFKKWVTSEVLPSIRKTGQYATQAAPATMALPRSFAEALRLAAEQAEQIERQEAALAIAEPKAKALDRLGAADGSMCVTDAAKALKVRPKDLFAKLQSERWIYRRPGQQRWIGYQDRIQSGLLEHKTTVVVVRDDGSERACEQVLVTAKGLAKLAEQLGVKGAA